MKQDDIFLQDIKSKILNADDITVKLPDRANVNRQIAQKLVKPKNNFFSNKIKMFATCASFVFVLAIMIPILAINKPDDLYFNDEDLVSAQISLEEFREELNNVKVPSLENYAFDSCRIFKQKNTNFNIYANLLFNNELNEQISLFIVFINHYNILTKEIYDVLQAEKVLNNISFKYYVPQEGIAYSYFELDGNKYYMSVTSYNPEVLFDVIQSLK